MVKFGRKLRVMQVPKWRQHYFPYHEAKKRLYRIKARLEDDEPGAGLTSALTRSLLSSSDLVEDPEDGFGAFVEEEVARVERFFVSKRDELQGRLDHQIEMAQRYDDKRRRGSTMLSSPTFSVRSDRESEAEGAAVSPKLPKPEETLSRRGKDSLKHALVSLYREASKLESFGLLNYTAVVKITKKHDKTVPGDAISAALHARLRATAFGRPHSMQALQDRVDRLYAQLFTDGDVVVARSQMLARHGHQRSSLVFQVGMQVGFVLVLVLWFVWDAVVDPSAGHNFWDDAAMPVYRGLGNIVLMVWLWGFNVWAWNRVRINYLYIFDLDPAKSGHPLEIWGEASTMSIVFMFSLILYYKVIRHDFTTTVDAHWYPLLLTLYVCIKLVFPWSRRKLLWQSVWEVMASPFVAVSFRAAYMGDVLTSLVRVFTDLAFIVCYYTSGQYRQPSDGATNYCDADMPGSEAISALLHSLPLWWRFLQNIRRFRDTGDRFPHIANAMKYAVAQSVVLFGVFKPDFYSTEEVSPYQVLWLLSFVASTAYLFIWDVKMDWGLVTPDRSAPLLRKTMMYPKHSYYYTAMVVDFFLRITWTLSLIPEGDSNPLGIADLQVYLSPFLAAAELCRRSMWSCFRLENEHLSNSYRFRREDFVPLHFDDFSATEEGEKRQNMDKARMTVEIAAVVALVVGVTVAAAVS